MSVVGLLCVLLAGSVAGPVAVCRGTHCWLLLLTPLLSVGVAVCLLLLLSMIVVVSILLLTVVVSIITVVVSIIMVVVSVVR